MPDGKVSSGTNPTGPGIASGPTVYFVQEDDKPFIYPLVAPVGTEYKFGQPIKFERYDVNVTIGKETIIMRYAKETR